MTMLPAETRPAVLEIQLDAIVANWRLLSARHPWGAVGAVVKADAYGLGASKVAPALHAAGCRHFFTALLDEALALRPLLPEAMLPGGMLAGGMLAVLDDLIAGTERIFREQAIVPVLGSLPEIACWRAEARRAGAPLEAILHIDTGMARLGLTATEVAALADDRSLLDGIRIRTVMTHLVAAECPGDPINERQRQRFATLAQKLPPAPRSFANSSGIFLGPRFASALARPGAALYGINPTPGQPNPMRPVLRLRGRVLALRDLAPGETVGYNATWQATRPSRIATVGIGYADGWLRSLSNRGAAFFDGRRLPLVGRVSMDLTTYDATGLTSLAAGDWLELIGPAQPLASVAEAAGTNEYEILTALGRRYRRVWLGA
ncbi:MAG: alanine racemase [Acetobacteraceae bacterium]